MVDRNYRSFTPELRKEAVSLASEIGALSASIRLGLTECSVREWCRKAGVGLPMRVRQRYSAEEKTKALQRVSEVGTGAAAVELDIPTTVLAMWHLKTFGASKTNPKYTAEQKSRALDLLRESGGNVHLAAEQSGISVRKVRDIWTANRGDSRRVRPKSFTTYTAEQREVAVALALKVGSNKAARELKIGRTTVSCWLQEAKRNGAVRRTTVDHADTRLEWVARNHPELEVWRGHAVIWLSGCLSSMGLRLHAIRNFFRDYLLGPVKAQMGLVTPAKFLSRDLVLPSFFDLCCSQSNYGRALNNVAHEFLQWLLIEEFSIEDDYGRPVVSPAFHNPIPRIGGFSDLREESVYSPLPYGYIDELRNMLAEGPHFRDWKLAQSFFTKNPLTRFRGSDGTDWFSVTEEQIDYSDPDCVWRIRKRNTDTAPTLEMWSPVRWVGLLAKLILPLRTFQVRMLDSGEADTWRYSNGQWDINTNKLKEGTERKPLEQGVFRRSYSNTSARVDSKHIAQLYINTNKTNDLNKSGAAKGYIMPWVTLGSMASDIYYWLEKLRNWQEKYNPVSRRTPWTELVPGRHLHPKSAVQLATYPDACFLFRLAEAKDDARHLPPASFILEVPWYYLLRAFQDRLAKRGESHADGSPITLVYLHDSSASEDESSERGRLIRKNVKRTHFPLHSLRVSIITALAVDGDLPFLILQKLVGHSRLLMTLYYTKINGLKIQTEIDAATARMEENKQRSIIDFLRHTEYQDLLRQAICNNEAALGVAIPEHPAARNPAGWMLFHHGACLVGGNTSPLEENNGIGGCYNGGPCLRNARGNSTYGPVPGGCRNCIRCRWFVTAPQHLAALVAHGNVIAYHLDEARNSCAKLERLLAELLAERVDAESNGWPFEKASEISDTERRLESAAARFSDRIDDFAACWRLIQRCRDVLNQRHEGSSAALVLGGSVGDFEVAIQDTDSELLQLCIVCETVELYPDHASEDAAVIHRGQLLDAALLGENIPPVFLTLGKEEQLRVGNEFIRNLAHICNPQSWHQGREAVVAAIDGKIKLSTLLGVNVGEVLAASLSHKTVQLTTLRRVTDASKN